MKILNVTRAAKFGAAALAVTMLSASVASAESFTLRIGSGQPMKPLEPIFKADGFFVPEVSKRVAVEPSDRAQPALSDPRRRIPDWRRHPR